MLCHTFKTSQPFTIYPSPVLHQLNIITNEDLTGGTVRVYDMVGKQVIAARPATKQVDVSKLAPGVYTLIYTKNGNTITKRFIK